MQKQYFFIGAAVMAVFFVSLSVTPFAANAADIVCPAGYRCERTANYHADQAIPATVNAANPCYTLSTNLSLNSKGTAVTQLTNMLVKEGFMSAPTGTFGESVASAVVGFQQKYASEILTPNGLKYGTGYVGPSTRQKLNSLYGCGSQQGASDFRLYSSVGQTDQNGTQVTYSVQLGAGVGRGSGGWTLRFSCPPGVSASMKGGDCSSMTTITSGNQWGATFANSTNQNQTVGAEAQLLSGKDGSVVATDKDIIMIQPTNSQTGCYVFSTNLQVGSTGPEVIELQTWLIANGFNIPSIASGQKAKGYFDSETSAALRMYQTSKGIPETGFFGPLTRAAVNGSCDNGKIPVACPVNYICTPGTPTTPQVAGCPSGYICTYYGQSPTQPTVNSISPSSGAPGTLATLYGSNLSKQSIIVFGGKGIVPRNVSPNSGTSEGTWLSVIIPYDLAAGNYDVSVTNSANGSSISSYSSVAFNVTSDSQPTVCPSGYTCNYNPGTSGSGNCPANYTCTYIPVVQTNVCPSGYTCLYVYGTPGSGVCPTNYICTPVATQEPTVTAGPIVNPGNGHSYYLLSPSPWKMAENKATQLGGHLVTINDSAENTWIANTFSRYGGTARYLWIGLNDANSEGNFVWTSGEPLNYKNWASGEPNNGGGYYSFESAVLMLNPDAGYGSGAWNDAQETISNSGVVEVGSSQQSNPAIDHVTVSYNGVGTTAIQKGNTYLIKWSETNTKDKVRVSLYKLQGMTWVNSLAIGSVEPVGNGTNQISWSVPSGLTTDGSQYKIYVETIGAGGQQYITFSSSNPQPSITATPDSMTPISATLAAGQSGIVLAVIDLKATGGNISVNQISAGVSPVSSGVTLTNVAIYQGTNLIGSIPTLANTDTQQQNAVWGSVNIPTLAIQAGNTVPLTLKADISANSSGTFKFGIVGLGYDMTQPPIISQFSGFGNQMTVASLQTTVSVSNASTVLGAPVLANNTTVAYPVSFNFTLTANNAPAYVSSTASLVQWIASASVVGNVSDVSVSPGSISGDSSEYYIIPPGSSRAFTVSGILRPSSSVGGGGSLQISTIYYGSSASNLQSGNIGQGLDVLKAMVVFPDATPVAPSTENHPAGTQLNLNDSQNQSASIWNALNEWYSSH